MVVRPAVVQTTTPSLALSSCQAAAVTAVPAIIAIVRIAREEEDYYLV